MSNAIDKLMKAGNIASLPLEDIVAQVKRAEWKAQRREDQSPTSRKVFDAWMLLGGRGSGKTRAGAEQVWWDGYRTEEARIAVIGPTFGDVRKTCFEGESGLIACIPKELVRNYNRGSLELWLHNGAYFIGYSSEEPERLRGPQHHIAWCDELAAWKYPDDTWDMMQFGLRLGKYPFVIVTTTPKPIGLVKQLIKDPTVYKCSVSTFANAANLPAKVLEKWKTKYEGTRIGRQELYAELLDDNPYALFKQDNIDKLRAKKAPADVSRVVVAVDPPVTSNEESDECGCVVACLGGDGHAYILHDGSSQGLTPQGWGLEAVRLYKAYMADYIVGEVNQGGDMVEAVIRMADGNVNYKSVHATRGKVRRAEPIAALYEQGRVHHVGTFGALESQMTEFTSDFDTDKMGYSPDRVDALVWALTELMVEQTPGLGLLEWYKQQNAAEGNTVTNVNAPVNNYVGNRPDAVFAQEDRVPMLAPPQITGTYYSINGSAYNVHEGKIAALPNELEDLERAGFERITGG